MKQYKILNVKGQVIGCATADNPQAAVRAWNLANKASHEVAVDAIESKPTTH